MDLSTILRGIRQSPSIKDILTEQIYFGRIQKICIFLLPGDSTKTRLQALTLKKIFIQNLSQIKGKWREMQVFQMFVV